MNEVIRTIMDRKSIRAYEAKDISEEEKQIILEAACAAPTAGNQQMYTIINVTDQSIKDKLVHTCDHQEFIAEAKMVLIFCADVLKWHEGFMDCNCGPRDQGVGDLFLAMSDANIAAQNAVIAASSLGIGSCYIGDIMENYEKQKELLSLPDHVFPCAMLVFGYPTKQQAERVRVKRAPLDTIVSKNAYPQMDKEYRKRMFFKGSENRTYEEWMDAFCKRKYNSDFSKEMTRSVKAFLRQFD